MSVRAIYRCDSCDAVSEVGLQARFEGIFSGRTHGFVRTVIDRVEDLAPEGWVAFDPFTHCCYCPTCWASILAPVRAERAETQEGLA